MDAKKQIEMHEQVVSLFKENCLDQITKIAGICGEALHSGNKILFCGNGGSAADSQHLAAEFVGRFVKEREALPAIALTTDTSILTAIGNDYGYQNVFKRQVTALGVRGDVFVGISTSGNSQNVVLAMEEAKRKGLFAVAFTGIAESKLSALADITLRVPSMITSRIQECHILAGHIICGYIDEDY